MLIACKISKIYYRKYIKKELQYANVKILYGLRNIINDFSDKVLRRKCLYTQLFSQLMNIYDLKVAFSIPKKKMKLVELNKWKEIAKLYKEWVTYFMVWMC